MFAFLFNFLLFCYVLFKSASAFFNTLKNKPEKKPFYKKIPILIISGITALYTMIAISQTLMILFQLFEYMVLS